MTAIGIYRLFASAALFIIWATHMVAVASVFGVDDPPFNASVSVPFVERVADKYVSDCLSYAWVHAYDDLHPNDATAITETEVNSYFIGCLSAAASRVESNIPYVSSVQFNGVSLGCADWNYCQANVSSIQIDFNFPLSRLGYSDDIVATFSISSHKEMNIVPTGYVVLGLGRAQYRVIVRSIDLNIIEVNGLWPR